MLVFMAELSIELLVVEVPLTGIVDAAHQVAEPAT